MSRARYRKEPADGEKNPALPRFVLVLLLILALENVPARSENGVYLRYGAAMHIPTHMLAGWCLANVISLTPRERLFTMVAATVPDVDGLSLLAGIEAYGKWHHTFGHNALFAIGIATVLAVFSTHRWRACAIYLIAGHLHLVMDLFGSGVGWGIPYWWPFSAFAWESRHAWSLSSWQNFTAGIVTIVATVVIAIWKKRSPFECLAPTVEAHLFRKTHPLPHEPAS